MVFHRFLSGEVRGKRLAIYVNENKVAPWDAFARSEKNTRKLEAVTLRLDGQSGRGDIIVEPFVLPHQSRFSSPEAFNRASGPEKWNRQQGFYIYRADRMIQSGGWSGLRALDEHRKLSRIAISFTPKLDEEFKINVAKMRVSLPAALRDSIAKSIASAVSMAEEEYRQSERKGGAVAGQVLPAHVPPPVRNGNHVEVGINGGTQILIGGDGPSEATPMPPPHAPGRVRRSELEHVTELFRKIVKPEEREMLEALVARATPLLDD
jgi:hypothetical protein